MKIFTIINSVNHSFKILGETLAETRKTIAQKIGN